MGSASAPIPSQFVGQTTSRVSSVLSYAILLGGLLTIALTLYMVVTSYSSLPFWDGWEELRFAASGGSLFSPVWLFRPHNEHLMPIPKLFLAVDARLFKARQAFLLGSIFAIQFIHVALLSWSMRVLGGWRWPQWRTGTGLAAFCLFCPSQFENFVWGFQVGFVLPQFFATLSFVALSLYLTEKGQQPGRQPSPMFLVLSILAALGASYSLASGNLLWPLLIGAALYLRLGDRAVGGFAIVAIANIAFYVYRYAGAETHANPIASLRAPLELLKYCSVYFLSSWPRYETLERFVPLLVILIVLLPVLPHVRTFRPFAILLVLTMLYCLAAALLTATGRLSLGISQAATSRYQSVALLFWCCLGLLCLGCAFQGRHGLRHWFLVAQVFLILVFARAAVRAKYPIESTRSHAFTQQAAAAALLTGIFDPVTLGEVYPEVDVVTSTVPYLKANRLSVFSGGLPSELGPLEPGRSLDSVIATAGAGKCTGTLESVAVESSHNSGLGPGERILGRAWDTRSRRLPSAIVVTANGVIVGLGATGRWRKWGTDAHGNPGLPSRDDGFVAFTPKLPPGATPSIYAVLHGAPPSACFIDRLLSRTP